MTGNVPQNDPENGRPLWVFKSTHLCELSSWRRHQGLYDTVSLHSHEDSTAKQLQHSCCRPEEEEEQDEEEEQFLYFFKSRIVEHRHV